MLNHCAKQAGQLSTVCRRELHMCSVFILAVAPDFIFLLRCSDTIIAGVDLQKTPFSRESSGEVPFQIRYGVSSGADK